MVYTWTSFFAAIAAATNNTEILAIKTQMQADMTSAGLSSDLTDQVNDWLDQIVVGNSFDKNQILMNNAGSLFTFYTGLRPPESAETIYTNAPLVVNPAASTSGAVVSFTVSNPANTGQTAGANIQSVLITTTSRQWLTGAIAQQDEVRITGPTYSAVGASVMAQAATLRVAMPTAGSNMTFTDARSAIFQGPILLIDEPTGTYNSDLQINSAFNGRVIFKNTVTSAQWVLSNSVTGVAPDLDSFAIGTTVNPGQGFTRWKLDGVQVHQANVQTSGAATTYAWTKPNNTGQTASTEITSWLYTIGSRQWATGNFATQREVRLTAPTYTAVGASVITTVSVFDVAAPVASTNITITNPFTATFQGHVGVLTTLQLGSTTTIVTSTFLQFAASTTAKSLMNLAQGAAPTAPVDGDVWREDNTNTGLKIRIAGVTKTIVVA